MAETIAKPGHNVADPAKYAELFKSFFRIEDDINTMRMRHAKEVGELNAQQKQIKAMVKDAGYSAAGFRELVLQEKARRAEANRLAELEDDVRDEIDHLKDSLGDLFGTPLGNAVLSAADGDEDDNPTGNNAELLNNLTSLEPASATPN